MVENEIINGVPVEINITSEGRRWTWEVRWSVGYSVRNQDGPCDSAAGARDEARSAARIALDRLKEGLQNPFPASCAR